MKASPQFCSLFPPAHCQASTYSPGNPPREFLFCKVVKHTQHSFAGYVFRTCLRQALLPVNDRAEIFLVVLHIGWYTQKLIIHGIELQFTAGLQGLQSGCQERGRIAYLGMEMASGSALSSPVALRILGIRAEPAHSAALSRDLSEAALGASCSACLFRALSTTTQGTFTLLHCNNKS